MRIKKTEIFCKILAFVMVGGFSLMFILGVFNFFRFFFLLRDYLGVK